MLMPNGNRKVKRVDSLDKYLASAPISLAPAPTSSPPGFVDKPKKNKRRITKRLVLAGLSLPVVLALSWIGYIAATHLGGKFSVVSIISSGVKAATGYEAPIKGQDRGRTNILVYGMTKDGMRTDSIVLVSYYWQQKKMVTLNIPRDLYVSDGYEYDKMGEIYAYAHNRQPKSSTYPSTYVASIISKEYNLPIDYYAKLNMQGEVDLINAIGGVDVNVPDAFTDYEYPTWNYTGYIRPAPHFSAGPQHMAGDTALIFSRSRHSLDNQEGSDFARSNRQALVIQAVMSKVKSLGIVGNLVDINHYLTILGKNVDTNMSTDEMVSFAKTTKALDPQQDLVHGNWSTSNGFLCDSTSSYGAYIILYGNSDTCGVMAGSTKTSHSKQLALYYVQNLLASAPQVSKDFIASATQALWPPKQSMSAPRSVHATLAPGSLESH